MAQARGVEGWGKRSCQADLMWKRGKSKTGRPLVGGLLGWGVKKMKRREIVKREDPMRGRNKNKNVCNSQQIRSYRRSKGEIIKGYVRNVLKGLSLSPFRLGSPAPCLDPNYMTSLQLQRWMGNRYQRVRLQWNKGSYHFALDGLFFMYSVVSKRMTNTLHILTSLLSLNSAGNSSRACDV